MSTPKQVYAEFVIPKPLTPDTSHRRSKLIGGTVMADYINNDDGTRVIIVKLKQSEAKPVAKTPARPSKASRGKSPKEIEAAISSVAYSPMAYSPLTGGSPISTTGGGEDRYRSVGMDLGVSGGGKDGA